MVINSPIGLSIYFMMIAYRSINQLDILRDALWMIIYVLNDRRGIVVVDILMGTILSALPFWVAAPLLYMEWAILVIIIINASQSGM